MNSNTSINNTTFFGNFQLFLPINLSILIDDDAPVKVISKILEGLDYRNLMSAYFKNKKHRARIEPTIMFSLIAYAMYDGVYSTRQIEKNCKENINYMWILHGRKAPDHNTIARFINKNTEYIEDLFYQFVRKLAENEEIDFENIFIDGTKIEANANKYTFVWKKAVLKNYEKLKNKAIDFWATYNLENGTNFDNAYELKEYLENEIKEKNIELKYGRGHRKTQIQRDYETVLQYIEKEQEYLEHIDICGNRNSYAKTDNDATFMRMKDDHMKNGQLKPAYNLQIGVNSEYIVGAEIFSNPTDVRTLPPFLAMLEEKNFKYQNIVADAGYESEENYEYLKLNGYTSYIKPQNYEKKKTRKYKKDISKAENMEYDIENDIYICVNGKKLNFVKILNKKNESGYVSEKKVYECESCLECSMKTKCTKSKYNKKLYVAHKFLKYRDESEENITSEYGRQLRMNRSIQVEGAFGVLKQNMNFTRFRYRSMEKVKTEVLLYSFGFNLRKYINKKEQKRLGMKLYKLKEN